MLHQEILKFRAKRNIKNRKAQSGLTYNTSKSIGIIANVKENKSEWFLALSDSLRTDQKDVKFIGICNDAKKRINFSESNVFSSADIGILGRINNPSLLNFINQSWDFLIVIDHSSDVTIRYISSVCRAGYIIGVQDKQNDLYDLQIKSELTEELYEVIKYIKRIK